MLHLLAVPVALVTLVVGLAGQCVTRYPLSDGVGDPWGTTLDQRGNVWFAEAGCDFEATCTGTTAPGQLGVLYVGASAPRFYTLPTITGNQPIFVVPDASGNIWFTTPNNSRIGEFDPVTQTLVGQWPVTQGSGPWDLVFSGGALWYTERFSSAVGRFDPLTHSHVDFSTPTANTHPYGIAAQGSRIWFAENNATRIAALDTARNDHIDEYPLRGEQSGALTPHLLSIDDAGDVWWSGGWTRVVGKLDPTIAKPGSCGARSGSCTGVTEYALPDPPPTCHESHVSGVAVQHRGSRVWLTDSLSGEVGYFDTLGATFALRRVRDCNAHSHDGLSVDDAGHVWWTEEFGDSLDTLVVPG